MDLAEAIQSGNMDEIIDSMNAYAFSRLKSVGVKSFDGREPIDFVSEVILKALEDQRSWSNARCSFKEFLFGCLKSEISNFFNLKKIDYSNHLPDFPYNENSSIDDQKKQVLSYLTNVGAEDDELMVFEYWMDGISKPSIIASELGCNVKEVYVIIKRLERHLRKIRTQVKDSL